MGSANGRHRRPRQAPAIVVAAGVTGSAIAIPLLGAAGAHAADASTWDRVAECESGGIWSADLGNGSYGGLQFSPELWKAYGGEAYAERADLASRSQQIAVAERVLAAKGPKAWPSCAVISGLGKSAGPADADAGDEGSDEPTRGADSGLDAGLGTDPADDASSDATATPSDEATDDAAGGTTADEGAGKSTGKHAGGSADASSSADPSADPSSTPSADPSGSAGPSTGASDDARETGGKHRGAPAADDTAEADSGRDTGRHASRGDAEARDGAAQAGADTYTVRPGDNLWAIADAQNLPGGWPELYEANKAEVGSDPDLILPGQNLDLGLSGAGTAAGTSSAGEAGSEAGTAADAPAEAPAGATADAQ
ncbi:LysM domain-containing protein [Streptomyces sp. KhCrAH-43]|uniref:transglycosylase family protein n=1 Tax=unclassified Streptomyces TaxID=2593676 RepID=UPI0003697995|nr:MULTISPECIES: transglycosylase family protein [unclassified Streptomyces]MYS36041.1 LysM peptidoglycan-binding domain-containing protein [Streptomyces sp. SID4920]MYX70670.1 LysM peptidoglycan-binding domain-containing protein [Streptomyces sp. SID8373]RAJ55819.1 LysM domain-containing protein [Streptomyces sp. KhCrAH-43]